MNLSLLMIFFISTPNFGAGIYRIPTAHATPHLVLVPDSVCLLMDDVTTKGEKIVEIDSNQDILEVVNRLIFLAHAEKYAPPINNKDTADFLRYNFSYVADRIDIISQWAKEFGFDMKKIPELWEKGMIFTAVDQQSSRGDKVKFFATSPISSLHDFLLRRYQLLGKAVPEALFHPPFNKMEADYKLKGWNFAAHDIDAGQFIHLSFTTEVDVIIRSHQSSQSPDIPGSFTQEKGFWSVNDGELIITIPRLDEQFIFQLIEKPWEIQLVPAANNQAIAFLETTMMPKKLLLKREEKVSTNHPMVQFLLSKGYYVDQSSIF